MQVDVENVFKRYDFDQDGALTLDELQTMMQDLGGLFGFEGEVDSSTLLALLDANGDGGISWQEWSHACAVWLAETRS
jgi:Ca2+-binding EF-hand superfamily protein